MATDDATMSRNIETALRIGAVFLVIYWVALIVAPFIPVLVWGIIIAVALYPAYRWLRARFGGRDGWTAVVFTALALVVLIGPAAWLGQEMVAWGTKIAGKISDGTLKIPAPPDGVATWPVIGERVHEFWSLASTNLSAAASQAEVQLRAIGSWLLKTGAGVGMGILQFTLSIIIAGALMAHADSAVPFAHRLASRLAPGSVTDFVTLSERTIRSVATGVIGVAIIQAALVGVGLVAIGVPAAPVWIIVCLVVGVVQLPVTIVTLPILLWVWGSHETLPAALFTLWIIPAGLADNVLKPILLGRGAGSPMLVIFVGAIGGFILAGIVGLFVGAVVVVLAYELFNAWLNQGVDPEPAPTTAEG